MSHFQLPIARKSWVKRQRALDALYAALDYRLIVVVAAAGYGKTSLLAQFARTEGFSFGWLTLDESDCDLRVFGEAVVNSLKQCFPGFGALTMQLLTSSSIIEQNLTLLVRTLARELTACMSQPLCLVLDDFHNIETSAPVLQFIDRLLSELPEEMHLIIASRNLPPLQLGVLIAQQQVAALGQAILRLDVEETRQVIASLEGLSPTQVSDETANKAYNATEGWLVGLLMTNYIGRMREAQVGLGAPRAVDLLADYLLGQIWQDLTESLREFLCRSSILDDISIPFCVKDIGWSDTPAQIAEIERRNLFIQQVGSPDSGGETTYRYHPLFREFLRQRLREDEPIRYTQLQHDVGAAYERNDEIELAVRHYLAGSWSQDVIRLIELHAPLLVQRGRYRTILEWLNRLDGIAPEARADRHVLWQFKIWSHLNLGEDAQAMEALDRLTELYLRTGDIARRQSLNIRRSLLLCRAGKFEEALAGAYEVTNSIYPQPLWVRIEALRIAAICLNELGRLTDAFTAITSAEQLARDWGHAGNEVLARCKLTRSEILDGLGDTVGALRAAAEAVGLAEQLQDDGLRAEATIDLVQQLLFSGSKEDLIEISNQGLTLADGIGNQALRVYGITTLANVYMEQERFDKANESASAALALARQITSPNERGVTLFRALITYAHVLHRNAQYETAPEKRASLLQQAITFAREATAIAETNHSIRLRLQAYARLGAILSSQSEGASQNEDNLAKPLLDNAEALQGQFHDNAVGEAYVWKLMAQWAKPTPDAPRLKTLVSLVRQLTQLRRQTYFIRAEGQSAWDTWQALSSAVDIETALAAHSATRKGTELNEATREAAQAPPQITLVQHDLRIFGFGPGRVMRADTPVTSSQWGWNIPRDLFFYILTARKATRAQIGLIFWPDSSTTSMQSSFHNAKFAIKIALGKPVMVYVDGAYSINPDLDYLYDVNSFEQLIANAKQVSREDALDDLISATSLYADDFLVGTDAAWAMQIRSELAQKHTQCCLDAADLAFALEQPDAVFNLLERAILRDPLNEQVARMLMKSQWQTGKRHAALKTYTRLKALLFDEMGISPEIETERLAATIKNSK